MNDEELNKKYQLIFEREFIEPMFALIENMEKHLDQYRNEFVSKGDSTEPPE